MESLRRFVASLAERAVSEDGARSAVLHLVVPRAGFDHAVAAGMARADSGQPAGVGDRFHVASVGKMFTAVLVARIAAAGLFGPRGLDTRISDIEAAHGRLVRSVHPESSRITLRHLLSHTSGLKDMITDDASGTAAELGGPAPQSIAARFASCVAVERRGGASDGFARRRWVPFDPERFDDVSAGVLNLFVSSGTAASPVGSPGERFHYSDTAYVLLGVLLEAVSGRPYHVLQRDQILDPLGMDSTSMAYRDEPRNATTTEMDVWLGDAPLISDGFDLSFDWAGGGQISTTTDLIAFLRAVVSPESGLVPHPNPLTQFGTPSGLTHPRLAMGHGMFTWDAGGRPVIGHPGAWGVRVFHDPETDAWLAGTVNQNLECSWMAEIFQAVAETFL